MVGNEGGGGKLLLFVILRGHQRRIHIKQNGGRALNCGEPNEAARGGFMKATNQLASYISHPVHPDGLLVSRESVGVGSVMVV
jgi:hypothetical protein